MTRCVMTLSRPLLFGVRGAFFGLAPMASTGTAPDNSDPRSLPSVHRCSDHPAAVAAAHPQGRSTGGEAPASAGLEGAVAAAGLSEPLRRGEFRDNANCVRNWMGGTCFLQDDSVCSLFVYKVNDNWYMDCY